MAVWTNLINALFIPGRPILGSTGTALRDNIAAGLEADATAPVNAGNWHPFNKVTNGDANTGAIWTFSGNGAVAAVTSPDFEDGYDYAFLVDRVNTTAGGGNFLANVFRETAGAYAGAYHIGLSASSSQVVNSFLELQSARRALAAHELRGLVQNTSASNGVTGPSNAAGMFVQHATAQKILRVQFTFSAGNFTGTSAGIYMYRRRAL